jgi:hypothetical protein
MISTIDFCSFHRTLQLIDAKTNAEAEEYRTAQDYQINNATKVTLTTSQLTSATQYKLKLHPSSSSKRRKGVIFFFFV